MDLASRVFRNMLISLSLLLLISAAAFGTANYVYHERSTNNVGCGGAYVSKLSPTSADAVAIRFKVEYQYYTNQVRIYYTTDGSNPSGGFGVGSGTTQVITASYECTFSSGGTVDVAMGTIPSQPAGTTVKYIVSAWHSGGGSEIFANSGEFFDPKDASNEANVFSYTVQSFTVKSLFPVFNEPNASASTNITVTFAQALTTSTLTNMVVHGSRSGLHAGELTWSGDTTATFNPNANFALGELVTVGLPKNILSGAGDTLKNPYRWQFRVGATSGTGGFVQTKYMAASGATGMTAGDWNGDGDIDLAAVSISSKKLWILHNDGNGVFDDVDTMSVSDSPYKIASGDMDLDGDIDLVFTANGASTSWIWVMENDGNGTFTKKSGNVTSPGQTPVYLDLGDLNGDGFPDVAVSGAEVYTAMVSIFLNDGSGGLPATYSSRYGFYGNNNTGEIRISDINNDGDLDIGVGYGDNAPMYLFSNDGMAGFSGASYGAGSSHNLYSLQFGDVDDDGDNDLATSNGFVSANNGSGSFDTVGTIVGGWQFDLNHFDGDGDLDILSQYGGTGFRVQFNDGTGEFPTVQINNVGFGDVIVSADLDNDGDLDVAGSNYGSGSVFVAKNDFVCPTITLSPSSLSTAPVNESYSQSITASGGTSPYSFSLSSGSLPSGVTLSSAGLLSGTPTASGTFNFTVTATDGNACPGNRSYSLVVTEFGSISGTKWRDDDGDGVKDEGEPTLSGWKIYLSGTAIDSTTTDASGNYSFTDLNPGSYAVSESLQADWIQTFPGGDGTYSVSLTSSGDDITGKDFGNRFNCQTITLSPSALLEATVGNSYNQTVTSSGGTSPYTYGVTSGSLPSGITVSSAGEVSGTAALSGSFTFTVTATDSNGCTGSRSYILVVMPAEIELGSDVLPPDGSYQGPPNNAYVTFSNDIWLGAFVIRSITPRSAPPALGNDAVLNFSAIVDVRVSTNGGTSFMDYTDDAVQGSMLVDHTSDSDSTRTFETEMLQLDLSGGSLPAGFLIRESPTIASKGLTDIRQAGGPFFISSFFDVFTEVSLNGGETWTPANGRAQVVLKDYLCPTVTLSMSSGSGPVRVGEFNSFTFSSTGGTADYTYEKISGTLPDGMSLQSNGTFSGTPTTVGSYDFTVRATDANGCTGTVGIHFVVDCPTIILSPSALAFGKAGGSYSVSVTASGGTGPYTFDQPQGSLPPGVTLSSSGLLSGIPTTPGLYSFTVRAFDSQNCTGSRGYVISVMPGEYQFASDNLPPDGRYTGFVTGDEAVFAGGVIIRNVTVRSMSPSSAPPAVLNSAIRNFSAVVDLEISTDGGSSFMDYTDDAVSASGLFYHTFDESGTQYFETEMLQLDLSGGTLPPSVLLRESPTLVSPGRVTIRNPELGDFRVSSFFDVFFEISSDDGASWSAADSPLQLQLREDCPEIVISPSSLPLGNLDASYNVTLTSSGGQAPYSYAVTAGDLPDGFSLSSEGVLAGSSSVYASSTITVTSTDANGCTASIEYYLLFLPESNVYPTDSLPAPGVYEGPKNISSFDYAGGIVIRNIRFGPLEYLDHAPTYPDGNQTYSMGDSIRFELSTDSGLSFSSKIAPFTGSFNVSYTHHQGNEYYFDAELLQLNIFDISGHVSMLLRESPTIASGGALTSEPVDGGWEVSSFFDVFTELSVDGGATWSPADSMGQVVLRRDCPVLSILCPADLSVPATSSAGASVTYLAPSVSGGCEPVSVVCNPPSGSLFPVGTTIVTCTATDNAGNTASCSFTVTVTRYSPPLTDLPPIFPRADKPEVCIPLIMNTDVNATESWFVKVAGSALKTRITAHAVNPTDPEKVVAYFYDDATNTLLGADSVSYSSAEAASAPGFEKSVDVIVTGLSAGDIVRVDITTPPPTPSTQPHYILHFEGAIGASVASPTFPSFEEGFARWFVYRATPGEGLDLDFFTTGVPTPASSVTYRLSNPSGALVSAATVAVSGSTEISAATGPAGMYMLEVVSINGHYRLDVKNGARRDMYVAGNSGGYGKKTGTIVKNGSTASGVEYEVKLRQLQPSQEGSAYAEYDSLLTTTGAFVFEKVPSGHYSVAVRPTQDGVTTPEVQYDTVACDSELVNMFETYDIPSVAINDVSVVEGNTGTTTTAEFTLTLSSVPGYPVTVNFETNDGSGGFAGEDYVAKSGTVTFTPPAISANISITVAGDDTVEDDETFSVILSEPQNASLGDFTGVGTIVNDDTTYDLGIIVHGGGTVTKDPDQVSYPAHSTVQVTAEADRGYNFTGWSGDASGTQNPLSVEMTGHLVIEATFELDSAYLSKYRSATYMEWATALDEKGKFKSIKRKPYQVEFEFSLAVEDPVLTLEFGSEVTTGKVAIKGSADDLALFEGKKPAPMTLEGVDIGDSIKIYGFALKGKQIKVKYKWGSGDKISLPIDAFDRNQPRLPMPNLHNVGEELFGVGGTSVFPSGLMVGSPQGERSANSVLHPKYSDVLKSLRKKDIFHEEDPACIDSFLSGKPMSKQQKSLPPDKLNNILFGELLALKLNIEASAASKFPIGLGELTYDDESSPDNPFNGEIVAKIARYGDTVISCADLSGDLASATIEELYETVVNINEAFSDSTIDTVGFAAGTELTGVRTLLETEVLEFTPGVAPRSTMSSEFVWKDELPAEFQLHQNYPNPFNPTTTLSFVVGQPSLVTLKIYTMLGQEVATLVEKEEMDEGPQEVIFDGAGLSSGLYFYRLHAEPLGVEGEDTEAGLSTPFTSVRKMLLVK